jgi:bla regulator protein blaR1
MRAFVLRHALEHIAARDPLLLMGALVAAALMPWNILLWWQLRRLRRAIEIDCNARVLSTSPDVSTYGDEMLRQVSRRCRRMPLGVAVLG